MAVADVYKQLAEALENLEAVLAQQFVLVEKGNPDQPRQHLLDDKAFNPDQPRHPAGEPWAPTGPSPGRFAPSGEDGGGSQTEPKLTVAEGVSKLAEDRVREAFAAIPPAHAEKLNDIPIKIAESTADSAALSSAGKNVVGLFSAEPGFVGIYLADKHPTTWISDGQEKTWNLELLERQRIATHEFGHAIDYKNGWKYNQKVGPFAAIGRARMNETELKNATHYLKSDKETFAELYSLAYNPNKTDKYFGGMDRARANTVFSEALTKLKSL